MKKLTLVLITVFGLMTGCGSSGTSTQNGNSQDPIETVSNMDELLAVVQPDKTHSAISRAVAQKILDIKNTPEAKKGKKHFADRSKDLVYTQGAMDVVKRWAQYSDFKDKKDFFANKDTTGGNGRYIINGVPTEPTRLAFSQENMKVPSSFNYSKYTFPKNGTVQQINEWDLSADTQEIQSGSSCGYALIDFGDIYGIEIACFKIIEK